MKTFIIQKDVVVSKEDYMIHLERKIKQIDDRKKHIKEDQARAIANYKNKQQKQLLEWDKFHLRYTKELEALKIEN
jgi:hypothetical protein